MGGVGKWGLGHFRLCRSRPLGKPLKHTAPLWQQGGDPLAEKRKDAEPTFGDASENFIASMEAGWRNAKHRQQWRNTLSTYCAAINDKQVSGIGTDDVLRVLSPIWREKPETASRVRGRIERVLDYAKARGWRDGPNPALWRGHLSAVLPARGTLGRGHHGAMPYKDVPAFVASLRAGDIPTQRVLEFTILTAARTGEVLGATWDEFDMDTAVWTIPASRMKGKREHRVPLSPHASEIVTHQKSFADDGGLVFPGARRGRPMSNMSLEMLLRRRGLKEQGITVHGFRSSFRDWAGEETTFPREVAEAALAHAVGDATERAYRRGDALEKRRELMAAWAAFMETAI